MSRAHVVHVVVAGEIGGAERMLTDLAARPESSDATHSVALFTPNERLVHMFRDAGLNVHDRGRIGEGPLPFLKQSLGRSDMEWIAAILTRERADVAHLHTFASQVLGTRAARHAHVRVLRTEHSTRAFDDPTCWPFSRWSLARADVSIAVSDYVRATATARAPWAATKMRVVRNGVDTERFAPSPPNLQPFAFVLVGRLERRKGADLAIEALSRVPGARLDVVGEGRERLGLERLANRLGVADRVQFHGHLDDPRPIVARADAALCSSRTEGLGIALLEAMAMARPIIGFAVGGVSEIVKSGSDGVLVPVGDVHALAESMREAARTPAHMRALGSAAREHVVEGFSIRAMCAGYGEVYAELAAPKERRSVSTRSETPSDPGHPS